MIHITVTVRNDNPGTIWNRLAARLGREPTGYEAIMEVRRILASPDDKPPPAPVYSPGVAI